MSAQILDGLALARQIRAELKDRVATLKQTPHLHVFVAEQDPASVAYVGMKRKWAEMAGMQVSTTPVGPQTKQEDLIRGIQTANEDPAIHGVLVQHPLPAHLDEQAALLALGPKKDVDGITPQSLGALTCGLPGFRCATPLGAMLLLEHHGIDLTGIQAVVVGRSVIVGKPMALMLLERNATVTIAHSKTKDLPDLCRQADLVAAAVGRPEMVKGDWIKPGAVVLDAGYNRVEGREKDVGDVDFESASKVASWITPVPGGLGPMTVASLLRNTVEAACKG